jgi:hypothetical protein
VPDPRMKQRPAGSRRRAFAFIDRSGLPSDGIKVSAGYVHYCRSGVDRMRQDYLSGCFRIRHVSVVLFSQPRSGAFFGIFLRDDLTLHGKPREHGREQRYCACKHASRESDPFRRFDIVAGRYRYREHHDDKGAQHHGQ